MILDILRHSEYQSSSRGITLYLGNTIFNLTNLSLSAACCKLNAAMRLFTTVNPTCNIYPLKNTMFLDISEIFSNI